MARRIRLSKSLIVRVIADIIMLNISLILALLFHFFIVMVSENATNGLDLFWSYAATYRNNALLLTLLGSSVFAISGFYTHGRAYRGRYKVLIVGQAVTLTFLLFGFLSYFFANFVALPRNAMVSSWLIATVLLIAARVWTIVWADIVRNEKKLPATSPRDARIRNVLVIGGAGYIGSALLPRLLKGGYSVRLLDLLMFGKEPIKSVIDHPNLEIIQADFRQIDKVVEAMQDVDAVIHLGAIVGDPACALDENLTIDVNLMATRMIAEVAKGTGVRRFIFASTCSVYGASDEELDEHSALNPVSLYARSKIASERVLERIAAPDFSVTSLRFGTIYGLSGRTRFDLVVNLLTAKALFDRKITVFGGDQWRPFVHVDDAALAVYTVLQAPEPLVRGQVFNIGSDEQNYTISQVGEMIHRMVPEAELISVGSDGDRRNYRVNFKKIRNTLGFEPQWTVEKGIQQVITAINNKQIQDYQGKQYSNVKFLTEDDGVSVLRRENGNWAHELINMSGEKEVVPIP
ncbi:MAG: NAD(P)-dependent oxidoreductase [Caldilineaceae bacterium]